MAFVIGRASGPAAVVTVDGSPFIFETGGANGTFLMPVAAGGPFTLRFFDAVTGMSLGTTSGQAPPAGATSDLGHPLAPASGVLTASVQPDARAVVDIGTPVVFTFSEPLDRATISPGAFVVTDAAGVRVFGRVSVGDDGRTVTFVPLRRWRYGTSYRYGVLTSVVAASGARLPQAVAGEFTTFSPSVLNATPLGSVLDVAVAGSLALVAAEDGH